MATALLQEPQSETRVGTMDVLSSVDLDRIRREFFYGLGTYHMNYTDFVLPQLFKLCAPWKKEGFRQAITDAMSTTSEALIYVGFPFCPMSCLFCTAAMVANREVRKRYMTALLREIRLVAQSGFLKDKRITGIYIGGGTPTEMDKEDIVATLDEIRSCFDVDPGCTITCEAHPTNLLGSRGEGLLGRIIEGGVNRISVGVQTFDDDLLRILNRRHGSEQVFRACELLNRHGIRFNTDIMLGLPNQTLESVHRDLDHLDRLKVPNVEFMKHDIINEQMIELYEAHPEYLTDDNTFFDMQVTAHRWARARGIQMNGSLSEGSGHYPYRHKWIRGVPYWAFGSRTRTNLGTVYFDKHEDLSLYYAYLDDGVMPIGRYRRTGVLEQVFRKYLLELQSAEGVDLACLRRRFGDAAVQATARITDRLCDLGLTRLEGDILRPTVAGGVFGEDIPCYIKDVAIPAIVPGAVRCSDIAGPRIDRYLDNSSVLRTMRANSMRTQSKPSTLRRITDTLTGVLAVLGVWLCKRPILGDRFRGVISFGKL